LGLFISDAWRTEKSYYGDRDCFLWTFIPLPRKYGWYKGCSDYFMLSTNKQLLVGGGGSIGGLTLDEDLNCGTTGKSTAFQNEPLTKNGRNSFRCIGIEVYGFG